MTTWAVVALIVLPTSRSRAYAFTLLRLRPILQISQLYDGNITLSPTNPQGDFFTNVMAGANLDYRSPGRSGSFQYQTVLEKFYQHPRYDAFMPTHFFQLADEELFSNHTQLSFNDWFLDGKVPSALSEWFLDGNVPGAQLTSGSEANPTPDLNSQLARAVLTGRKTTSNVANVNLAHNLSEIITLKAEIEQEFFSTKTTTSFLTSGQLQTDYSLLPTLSAGGSYGFYDFRLSKGSPLEANYPAVRLRWNFSRELTFEGSGGPILFESRKRKGSIKAGYQGSGTYESPCWQIIVKGAQEPGISSSGGGGLSRDASANFTYLLNRRTTLFAGLGYYEFLGGRDQLQVLGYGGGASYQWNKWLVLYTQYVGLQRYSGAGGGASSVTNIYMTGASISFELFRRAL